MSKFDSNDVFAGRQRDFDDVEESLSADEDLVMEQILENINNTPIGQVLKRIASLPEVRKEKILNVRQQLNTHNYDVNDRLDIALDKVLEELTA